jgi:ParB family chromosome partitioning protein
VLGVIHLDPASTAEANAVVKAERFYTVEDDGLTQDWRGNIWLNPPYSIGILPRFIEKLLGEVSVGNTKSAIILVNNATETGWFRRLAEESSAICFPTGRVRYWGPAKTKNSPLQGQAILYIGDKQESFVVEFAALGWGGRL